MRAKPGWVHGTPTLEEQATEKLRADVAAERQKVRGVENMPLDVGRARALLSEEERAARASQPRKRRWKALDRIDDELARLQRRQEEAHTRLAEAEQTLKSAPADDARALAEWLANGEKGKRPEPTVYERTVERDAAQLLVVANALELDRLLERRVQHVDRDRGEMLADARKDLDDLQARYVATVRELERVRDELLQARDVFCWAASYPEPTVPFGHPAALAVGLLEPVRRSLGSTARIDWASVLAVLEEDAKALAHSFSQQVLQKIGEAKPHTPEQVAMWKNSDDRWTQWVGEKLAEARGEFGR